VKRQTALKHTPNYTQRPTHHRVNRCLSEPHTLIKQTNHAHVLHAYLYIENLPPPAHCAILVVWVTEYPIPAEL
jgi:hypothetical protein